MPAVGIVIFIAYGARHCCCTEIEFEMQKVRGELKKLEMHSFGVPKIAKVYS
jgi:hypothetical protein